MPSRLLSVQVLPNGFINEVFWYDGKKYRPLSTSKTRKFPVKLCERLNDPHDGGADWAIQIH